MTCIYQMAYPFEVVVVVMNEKKECQILKQNLLKIKNYNYEEISSFLSSLSLSEEDDDDDEVEVVEKVGSSFVV